MSLIPICSKEQVLAYIAAVELLEPELYQSPKKEKILKDLIEFRITSQEKAQHNVTQEAPYADACGCMGGPEGCSMCYCSLTHKSYAYRFHLYLHYFYPETIND